MSNSKEPIRKLECNFDDNGNTSWSSFPSHKNSQIRGGCDLTAYFSDNILIAHGVNSTGEWFSISEDKLCNGLNKRLRLTRADYKFT